MQAAFPCRPFCTCVGPERRESREGPSQRWNVPWKSAVGPDAQRVLQSQEGPGPALPALPLISGALLNLKSRDMCFSALVRKNVLCRILEWGLHILWYNLRG